MAAEVEVVEGAVAVPQMKRAQAQKITKQIREAFDSVPDLLLEAFEGQAHKALGYETWEAYVTAEFRAMTRENSYRSIRLAKAARELTEVAGAPVTVTQRSAVVFEKRRDEVVEAVRAAVAQASDDDRAQVAQSAFEQAAVPVTRASRPEMSDGVRPSVPTWLKPVWPDVERAAAFTGANPFEFVIKSLAAAIGQMELPAPEPPVEKPARARRARQSSGAAQEGDRAGTVEAVPEGSDPFAPAV